MAGGLMNMPKLPGIPGVARLPKVADKASPSSGLGATAIPAIPHLAAHAKKFYVLRCTPSNIDERFNPPTDPE